MTTTKHRNEEVTDDATNRSRDRMGLPVRFRTSRFRVVNVMIKRAVKPISSILSVMLINPIIIV
ncbi:MAG: hypothetical protein JRD89_21160 [Deltaproteobacteria bacterium]|nr:hypothetical protein [Deltaproteobacteria bacterium]